LELIINDDWRALNQVYHDITLHVRTFEEKPIDTSLRELYSLKLRIVDYASDSAAISIPTLLVEWMSHVEILDIRHIGISGHLSVVFAMLENVSPSYTTLVLTLTQLDWLRNKSRYILDDIKDIDVTIKHNERVSHDTVHFLEDWARSRSLVTDRSNMYIMIHDMTSDIQNAFWASHATPYRGDRGLKEFHLYLDIDSMQDLAQNSNPGWGMFLTAHTKVKLYIKVSNVHTGGIFAWLRYLMGLVVTRTESIQMKLSVCCWIDEWFNCVKPGIDCLLENHMQYTHHQIQSFIATNQISMNDNVQLQQALEGIGRDHLFILRITIEIFNGSDQTITYEDYLQNPLFNDVRRMLIVYGILEIDISNTVVPNAKRQRLNATTDDR
jgi:hypothetical protein